MVCGRQRVVRNGAKDTGVCGLVFFLGRLKCRPPFSCSATAGRWPGNDQCIISGHRGGVAQSAGALAVVPSSGPVGLPVACSVKDVLADVESPRTVADAFLRRWMGFGAAGGGAGARQKPRVVRHVPAVFLSIEVGVGGVVGMQ